MFPLLYHTHHCLHSQDIPFWLSLADHCNGPILELGCGTGRVLLPLARAGRQVFGIDNDPAMLSFLSHSIPGELSQQVSLVQADFTRFCLKKQFELIIMPCNTYSTLTEPDRRATIECLRNQLSPAGIFAVSMPNPYLLRHLPAHAEPEVEESFCLPTNGQPVQVSSAWNRTQDVFTLNWYYDLLFPDGSVERISACIQHQLTPVKELLEEMREIGLHPDTLYGNFDPSEYTQTADHLIILASPVNNLP
ncbi:MAG: class I SAM-dependent methyltransferase [Anaerolineales bacterium]|nr:class I SAM-dependent methyltransferase [Anaerolineales bacterium]